MISDHQVDLLLTASHGLNVTRELCLHTWFSSVRESRAFSRAENMFL
jgi:hypothetical protein